MRSKTKTKKKPACCNYNTRLQKGGALLEDMRLLVRNWNNSDEQNQVDEMVVANLLGKHSRARAWDTFRRTFLPRFIGGNPADAWKIVRKLEDRHIPIEILRPVYYWITARNERLLYDFVCTELFRLSKNQITTITTNEVSSWIHSQLVNCDKSWTVTVKNKVARGILATLRDFGILEGAAKKKIAPTYIPIDSFAYIAFALDREGVSGSNLINHKDWNLFLFSPGIVERMFLEADRNGLVRFQAAGKIARIDFFADCFKEMADVIATRSH